MTEVKSEKCPWCGDMVKWNVDLDHWLSSGMAFCDRARTRLSEYK